MKKDKKKLIIYILIEMLFFAVLYLYLLNMKLAYSFNIYYDNLLFTIIVLGLAFIILFFGPMLNRFISLIYVSIFSIYLIAQKLYHNAFGQYFRLSYVISIFDEWTAMKSSVDEFVSVSDFKPLIIVAIVIIVFFVLYLLFQRKVIGIKPRLIIMASSLLLFIPVFTVNNKYNSSINAEAQQHGDFFSEFYQTDYYVYLTVPNTNEFAEKFGLLSLAYRDINSSYDTKSIYLEQKDSITELLNSRQEHIDNEMTGLFEGKNVLFVMAESFIKASVDEQLTPTLYKIMNEGINVIGYNNPLLSCSTSDSEIMANLSLIPNSNEFGSCYAYVNNYFPTTLANIFKNDGYQAFAYHNNYATYYNRGELFPNTLGYEKYWSCTDMGLESEASDTDYMDVLAWIYPYTDKKWMSYWITYSGHQPYDYSSVGVKEEYINQIHELYPDLNEELTSYLAKTMDLDKALEMFMLTLEYEGKLDDLVIVFFGDHYPKALDLSETSTYYSITGKERTKDSVSTGLFIYNSSIEGKQYYKTSTNLDLLPTVANMFGLQYDNSTILGRDIFDPTYEGFYFSDDNEWKTDSFTFNSSSGEVIEITQKDYLLNDAKKWSEYYIRMHEISKAILETDYFRNMKEEIEKGEN